MGAPKYMLQYIYSYSIQQKAPADHACEQRVIAGMFGNKEATAAASGFLVPADFDDKTAREAFEKHIQAYKATGGAAGKLPRGEPFGIDCLRLREFTVRRCIEELAWELVWTGRTATGIEWCAKAMEKVSALAERIKEAGGRE